MNQQMSMSSLVVAPSGAGAVKPLEVNDGPAALRGSKPANQRSQSRVVSRIDGLVELAMMRTKRTVCVRLEELGDLRMPDWLVRSIGQQVLL